jgi:molybdopterin molybdotransferase
MISVAEATSIILSHPFKPDVEKIDLRASCGRILAEALTADRDLPPYERVSMDGIAILHSSFQNGTRQFAVEGIQAAGMQQVTLKNPNGCIEVMTGASLPVGTDTVIRYEDVEVRNKNAQVLISDINLRQNIHPRGRDARKNQELLTPGISISPAEINLLASVGQPAVSVFALPKTAIISTGDELVDIDKTPLPHQIRRSNDAALSAALYDMGCVADTFHLTDSIEILKKKISDIFETYELVILSGGVSKGKFDFVPQVLDSLGVKKLFHQVSQKPGKPFWFGTTHRHTVFALPGNPVSTYMCFYRYIKPWLLKSMGADLRTAYAVLATDFSFGPALTYFLQVNVRNEQGKWMAWPEEGGGSGDFANLRGVNGFLELPLERNEFKAGEVFPFIPFRK